MIRKGFLKTSLALIAGFTTVVLAQSTDFSWGNVAIGGGGFVSAVIASPIEKNLFYARTDVGGAYRWDESAGKWIPLMDWIHETEVGLMGVEGLGVDPKTPGKVYMLCGTSYFSDGRTAFLRSKDYGNTWEKIYTWDTSGVKGTPIRKFGAHGNGMGRGNGERLAIDPNNPDIMFYGSRKQGLFKSIDNGSTWNHVDGFTAVAKYDTTWNGCGFAFVAFVPGNSKKLYAGIFRDGDNMFQSEDGGTTWSLIPNRPKPATAGGYVPRLMPQRIAVIPSDSAFYVTYGDGAGPHTMRWNEGWGMINDWYNRGAIFKYDVALKTWTDISPENYIDHNEAKFNADSSYLPAYGAICVNPANPLELIATHMGYWACQYWSASTEKYKGAWASNIYHSKDGGKTWAQFFNSGAEPRQGLVDGGIGWINGNSIHWAGSVVFDPFNAERVWVASGNGIFKTDNLNSYSYSSTYPYIDNSATTQQWAFTSKGVEECVPMELVSIPGGPMVSTIGDYDGYRHDDIRKYPSKRLITPVNGFVGYLGTTRALAYAYKAKKLVKVSDARTSNPTGYTDVPLSPLQFSTDSGSTWSVATYENIDATLKMATSVAISTDGAVTLWTPSVKTVSGNDVWADYPIQRYANSAWTVVTGIDGAYVVSDPEDASVFYAYKKTTGDFFKSTDKGVTFTKVSTPGKSDFKKFRVIPGYTGDIWLPLTKDGLVRSKDGGTTFTKIDNAGACQAVGFGKAATGKTYPTIFIYSTINNVIGVFQSIDEGATWTRINDDAHQYGGLTNGEFVIGDMNTFGVVYMSTAGRGIAARMPTEWTSTKKVSRILKNTNAAVLLANNVLSIKTASAGNPVSVSIVNLLGKVIFSRTLTNSESLVLSRNIIANGTYIVSAHDNTGVLINQKFRFTK